MSYRENKVAFPKSESEVCTVKKRFAFNLKIQITTIIIR